MIAVQENKALAIRTQLRGADVPRLQQSIIRVAQRALDSNGFCDDDKGHLATLLGLLEDTLMDEDQTERALAPAKED
jgi:hypothetical protein